MRFSIEIVIQCSNCENTFHSSSSINHSVSGLKPFEVSLCAVMVSCEIGRGRKAMCTFTAIMNMPPPLLNNNYDRIDNKLHKVYKEGSFESMKAAVSELRAVMSAKAPDDDIIENGISIDGT